MVNRCPRRIGVETRRSIPGVRVVRTAIRSLSRMMICCRSPPPGTQMLASKEATPAGSARVKGNEAAKPSG